MSYTDECAICGESGVVPKRDERVTRGTRLYRTLSDDYEDAAKRAEFSTDDDERAKAEKRLEHVAKWTHYCPEHAVAVGIAPAGVTQEVRYRCEECGHESDHHGTKPVGHGGQQAACLECGATALTRFRTDADAPEADR